MLAALIIVFREGFEAFLTVAIIFAFLRKTGRDWLRPSVYAGILASIVASFGLGYALMRISEKQSLIEGILGVVAAVLVATFVVHVWRVAPRMKGDMERRLDSYSSTTSRFLAIASVFGFTVLMVTREGMETALMLIQVRNGRFILGSLLGIGAAALMSWAWAHYGHRINLKRFFQVTGLSSSSLPHRSCSTRSTSSPRPRCCRTARRSTPPPSRSRPSASTANGSRCWWSASARPGSW